MFKSLRTKLIAVMVLLLLVFLSTVGILSYRTARQILEEQIQETAQSSADYNAQILDRFINGIDRELYALTVTPAIQSMDWQVQQPILRDVLDVHANWEDLFIVDTNGFGHNTDDKLVDLSNRNYINQALQSGELVVADPVISAFSNQLVVPIVQPIIPPGQRQAVGLIGMTMRLEYLQDMVQGMTVDGVNGHGVIINNQMITIAHVEDKYLGNTRALQDGNAAFRTIMSRMAQGEKALEVYEFNGLPKIMAFAPVERAGWSVALTADLKDVLAPVNVLRNTTIWVALIAIIIASLIAYFVADFTVKPVLQVQNVAEALANGDLSQTVEVRVQDEIGRMAQAINQAITNLRALIGQVAEISENVASSAEELSAASEEVGQATQQVADAVNQMARAADQQAKDSQDMSESVDNLSSTISQVAASSQTMTKDADNVVGVANDGGQLVEQTVEQMAVIKDVSALIGEAINRLGHMSKEIGQIVDVIAGIADQTNLLALNAAIEAARAGEQGRGFAVVAEEVRKLAEQSREAALQIAELITNTQAEMEKAVEAQDKNSAEVENGIVAINKTGGAFTAITEAVQMIVNQIQEVSAATQQLAAGSNEIIKEVESVAAIAEEAAAGTEEISASAEEQNASVEEIAASAQSLAEMAEQLQVAVTRFKL